MGSRTRKAAPARPEKYRGRRREPGLRVRQRNSAAARCGGLPSPLLHHPRRTETGEARAPVSPTPSGVDWAGNVEMRCVHRVSTCAGPFDAVIDVVRSRRLMRGARLLLLPALGLLCALLRCLRRLPSLLRHAALLAMSEWRLSSRARGDREHCIGITTAR